MTNSDLIWKLVEELLKTLQKDNKLTNNQIKHNDD